MSLLPRPFLDSDSRNSRLSLPSFLTNSDSSRTPSHFPPWYGGSRSSEGSKTHQHLSQNRSVQLGVPAAWTTTGSEDELPTHHWSRGREQRHTASSGYNQKSYGHPRGSSMFCDTCNRSFRCEEELHEHLAEHIKCLINGCKFEAHPKLVTLHQKMQHSTGLAEKIMYLDTPEDIRKWREERKRVHEDYWSSTAKRQRLTMSDTRMCVPTDFLDISRTDKGSSYDEGTSPISSVQESKLWYRRDSLQYKMELLRSSEKRKHKLLEAQSFAQSRELPYKAGRGKEVDWKIHVQSPVLREEELSENEYSGRIQSRQRGKGRSNEAEETRRTSHRGLLPRPHERNETIPETAHSKPPPSPKGILKLPSEKRKTEAISPHPKVHDMKKSETTGSLQRPRNILKLPSEKKGSPALLPVPNENEVKKPDAACSRLLPSGKGILKLPSEKTDTPGLLPVPKMSQGLALQPHDMVSQEGLLPHPLTPGGIDQCVQQPDKQDGHLQKARSGLLQIPEEICEVNTSLSKLKTLQQPYSSKNLSSIKEMQTFALKETCQPKESSLGLSPHSKEYFHGLLPNLAETSHGLLPHPTETSHRLLPHPTETSQGLLPHPADTPQGFLPHPAETTPGLLPHPADTSHGLLSNPKENSQGFLPHSTKTSNGLLPHPAKTSEGLLPHPTDKSEGLLVHPTKASQPLLPHQSETSELLLIYPAENTEGLLPHKEASQGLLPHPKEITRLLSLPGETSRGDLCDLTEISQGLLPHPMETSRELSPHPADASQGLLPHPAGNYQGLLPHPKRHIRKQEETSIGLLSCPSEPEKTSLGKRKLSDIGGLLPHPTEKQVGKHTKKRAPLLPSSMEPGKDTLGECEGIIARNDSHGLLPHPRNNPDRGHTVPSKGLLPYPAEREHILIESQGLLPHPLSLGTKDVFLDIGDKSEYEHIGLLPHPSAPRGLLPHPVSHEAIELYQGLLPHPLVHEEIIRENERLIPLWADRGLLPHPTRFQEVSSSISRTYSQSRPKRTSSVKKHRRTKVTKTPPSAPGHLTEDNKQVKEAEEEELSLHLEDDDGELGEEENRPSSPTEKKNIVPTASVLNSPQKDVKDEDEELVDQTPVFPEDNGPGFSSSPSNEKDVVDQKPILPKQCSPKQANKTETEDDKKGLVAHKPLTRTQSTLKENDLTPIVSQPGASDIRKTVSKKSRKNVQKKEAAPKRLLRAVKKKILTCITDL